MIQDGQNSEGAPLQDGRSIAELLAAYQAKLDAMPPEERRAFEKAQFKAQRESFIRAMGPCEHGDYDWETCPECLSIYAPKPNQEPTNG